MSKNCALSFKKDTQGFCNTIVNGKLRVKQTARIEKTLAVEDNLQVYNDANIGDTVNTCNITIKNQLIYSEPELINESGETLSQLKSLSFINTNGTGILEDGCCNGLYKEIIKIIDGEEVGWTSVGNTGDINKAVRIVTFDQNGDGPYIGGEFDNIAGITGLDHIAKWTGSSWTSIGNTGDINNVVSTIVFGPSGDGPYIGGTFENVAGITGLNNLAKWTGSSWTSVGNTGDINARVRIIAFDQNDEGPYIGGGFDDVAGITGLNHIAKWTGSSWTSVGNTGDISGSNRFIEALTFDQNGDGPYIGGNFNNVAGITGLNKLAKWTGNSWTSIGNTGDFDNNEINIITFSTTGEGPYIGGTINKIAGITGLDKLAKWTGSSWTSIGNTGDISDRVRSIVFDQNGEGPYIGGNFTDVAGIIGLDHIAKWTGSSWTSIGNTGDIGDNIRSIVFDQNGDGPYIGGSFTDVSGITDLDRLAKYNLDQGYKLTYNNTETHTLTNNGDSVTFIYNSDPTAEWIKLN